VCGGVCGVLSCLRRFARCDGGRTRHVLRGVLSFAKRIIATLNTVAESRKQARETITSNSLSLRTVSRVLLQGTLLHIARRQRRTRVVCSRRFVWRVGAPLLSTTNLCGTDNSNSNGSTAKHAPIRCNCRSDSQSCACMERQVRWCTAFNQTSVTLFTLLESGLRAG
jgi:hypothetical protein